MNFPDLGPIEWLFIAKWYALPVIGLLAFTTWLWRLRRRQRALDARVAALERQRAP